MKTAWDLSLLYTSLTDPRIERDQKAADKAVAAFAKKYRKDRSHLKDPKALAKALADFEKLIVLPDSKAAYYAGFRKELDTLDKEAEALGARLAERGTQRGNRMLFFALELGKVAKAIQKKFLAAEELAPFRYWLMQLFENAKYDLPEAEEKILSRKSDVAHGRWIQATDNILNKQEVSFGGKKIPLPKGEASYAALPAAKRRALYRNIRSVYGAVADVAESELNAIYTNKKIDDELRGMHEPYEATIRGYQNDVPSVLALVEAVNASVSIAHRFYEVKRKLLGLKRLTYADRNAPVGKLASKIPFNRASSIVRAVFSDLSPDYAAIFDRLFARGQVDVFPKKGKTGGAYCSSSVGIPTFVLLNHANDFHSLKTLAHEMGHAVHAERAKSQRPLYQGHPISTAETASTFFETAALHRIMRELPPAERLIALHDAVQDDIATVFRQIACFNFERELHRAVRAQGYVPKERIATLMNEAMARYLGSAFELEPEDGYFFVTWSHIRRFFYVYSYAYGQLISKALHRRLTRDSSFIAKVDGFLAAGESKSPHDIFKTCGIDTKKPAVFLEGLKAIEADVAELEKLAR